MSAGSDEELEAQLERTNSKIIELEEACRQRGGSTEAIIPDPVGGLTTGDAAQDLLGLFSAMPDDAMLARLPSNSLLSMFSASPSQGASEPAEGSAHAGTLLVHAPRNLRSVDAFA